MMTKTGALGLILLLGLASCSKKPINQSGSGYVKLKSPVWAAYAWTNRRVACIIYFVTPSGMAVNPEGFAPTVKTDDKTETIEGSLDGYLENSKAPYRCEPKRGELVFEKKTYRLGNGSVFLINVGTPSKVVQLQVPFPKWPRESEDIPSFLESEVRRIAKETPRIAEFPKEPAADKAQKK